MDAARDQARPESHGARAGALATAAVCAVLIVAPFFLSFDPAADTRDVTAFSMTLPPTCASQAVLGLACPGCGLTRSFILFADGQWLGSLRFHRLGGLLYLYLCALLLSRLWWFCRPLAEAPPLAIWLDVRLPITLAALFGVNWGARLIFG
jgi:hypothetical protein